MVLEVYCLEGESERADDLVGARVCAAGMVHACVPEETSETFTRTDSAGAQDTRALVPQASEAQPLEVVVAEIEIVVLLRLVSVIADVAEEVNEGGLTRDGEKGRER